MNVQTLTPAVRRDDFGCEPFANAPEPNPAPRILLAEDDDAMRRFLSAVLVGQGFEVTSVADGAAAWEALVGERYELLLTDHEMPRLTGLQLIARLRTAGRSLPVILVSGSFVGGELPPHQQQLQIAALLGKPFGLPELLHTVNQALASAQEIAPADPASRHQLQARP